MSPLAKVVGVGFPAMRNHEDATPNSDSTANIRVAAAKTGFPRALPNAAPATRTAIARCPPFNNSPSRSVVSRGHIDTTSRSCVIATAQRWPPGHGDTRRIGIPPAPALTRSARTRANSETTGVRSRPIVTRGLSAEGTRPNLSAASVPCSIPVPAVSAIRSRIARLTVTPSGVASICAVACSRVYGEEPFFRVVRTVTAGTSGDSVTSNRDRSTRTSMP